MYNIETSKYDVNKLNDKKYLRFIWLDKWIKVIEEINRLTSNDHHLNNLTICKETKKAVSLINKIIIIIIMITIKNGIKSSQPTRKSVKAIYSHCWTNYVHFLFL